MQLTQIGTVESRYDTPADPFEMREKDSRIIIHPDFAAGLYDLDRCTHIQVLFGLHLARGYDLRTRNRLGEDKGVFATRSPRRPSPIGLTTVELLGMDGTALHVRGLDAMTGSPVYDIKPFVPALDGRGTGPSMSEEAKLQPRRDFIDAIESNDATRCLMKAAEIHGHYCPGLALGVMASLCGLRRPELGGLHSDGMEDLMAVVETNNCFSDGVQAVSGCTLGNNALVYRDLGRTAVTFARRDREPAVRVRVRPDFRTHLEQEESRFSRIMARVVGQESPGRDDVTQYKVQGRDAAFAMVRLPFDDLLIVEAVRPDLPDRAVMVPSALCPCCGEPVMSTRTVAEGVHRGRCLMCAGEHYSQLDGRGIVTARVGPERC